MGELIAIYSNLVNVHVTFRRSDASAYKKVASSLDL